MPERLLSIILRHQLVSTFAISAVIVAIAVGLSIISFRLVGEARPGLLYEALSALAIASLLAPTFLYPWIRTAAKLRSAELANRTLATTDALPGLPNTLELAERFAQLLGDTNDSGQFAVLFIDLDQFKRVNDALGHPRGDALLAAVAQRLRNEVAVTDLVTRFGGDEFVVLKWPLASLDEASSLAARLISSISAAYSIEGQEIVIGASVGIAVAPVDGSGRHQLLRNADMALSQAKAQGRRTWRFFEPAMAAAARARRNLENDLRSALAARNFELHYQPVVELRSGRITGCEALVRWRDSNKRIVLPSEFIGVAEQIGIITEIGNWVLCEACTACRGWPDDIRVAVNLSSLQFIRADLLAGVSGALAQADLPPERLELEITESVLLQDFVSVRATLERLRQLGVRIALDDFGTGYSSLSYLKSLPLDKVKIDRSFVADLDEGARSLTLLRGVTKLCASLGMTVVVEGVETQEQLAVLTPEDSIDEVQGYLFGPPMPNREINQLLGSFRSTAGSDAGVSRHTQVGDRKGRAARP